VPISYNELEVNDKLHLGSVDDPVSVLQAKSRQIGLDDFELIKVS